MGGRHRAPKRKSAPATLPALAVLGVVMILLALIGFATIQLRGPKQPSSLPVADPTLGGSDGIPARLEVSQTVDVDDNTVTITQTNSLTSGGPVELKPRTVPPPAALIPVATKVVQQTGVSSPFTDAIRLTAGSSVVVQSRLRLASCPDLIPTRWPSPTIVTPGGWTRVVVAAESPLRTARALCPGERISATPLDALRARLDPDRRLTLRLTWRGKQPLTVSAIGSASGVAAVALSRNCQGRCAARLAPNSSSAIPLEPVEACPSGGRSAVLTLLVTLARRDRLARLDVPRLGRAVCSHRSG